MSLKRAPGIRKNIGSPTEIYLKIKYRMLSFTNTNHFNWRIRLRFCTQHGSVKLSFRFVSTNKEAVKKRDSARFQLWDGFRDDYKWWHGVCVLVVTTAIFKLRAMSTPIVTKFYRKSWELLNWRDSHRHRVCGLLRKLLKCWHSMPH